MDWARILAPLSGGEADRKVIAAAADVARAFDAEMTAAHAPADISDLMPWLGDSYMGGVQPAALESLREATAAGADAARRAFDENPYPKKTFLALESPVWAALAMEGRLSDLVVFDSGSAKGKGALSEAFQQVLADEQRPILVTRGESPVGTRAVIAWDGGKEATRAVRTALPLLQKASNVIILHAPAASQRRCDPAALQHFLSQRGVSASVQILVGSGDPAPTLLHAARDAAAGVMVAGAFGHRRLQEFIFGGSTRTLLHSGGPSLFLSH